MIQFSKYFEKFNTRLFTNYSCSDLKILKINSNIFLLKRLKLKIKVKTRVIVNHSIVHTIFILYYTVTTFNSFQKTTLDVKIQENYQSKISTHTKKKHVKAEL